MKDRGMRDWKGKKGKGGTENP
jgi:hypothetical protein